MKLIKIIPICLSTLFLFSCSAETTDNKQLPELSKILQPWVLVTIDNENVSTQINSTLTLIAPDKATGVLGCNYFSGTLEQLDNQLRIDKMSHTRKRCQNEEAAVEAIIASTLSNWSNVAFIENDLILKGKTHQLHYKRQQ